MMRAATNSLVVEVGAHELDRLQSHTPEPVGAGDVLAVLGAAAVHGADELTGHAGVDSRAGRAFRRSAPTSRRTVGLHSRPGRDRRAARHMQAQPDLLRREGMPSSAERSAHRTSYRPVTSTRLARIGSHPADRGQLSGRRHVHGDHPRPPASPPSASRRTAPAPRVTHRTPYLITTSSSATAQRFTRTPGRDRIRSLPAASTTGQPRGPVTGQPVEVPATVQAQGCPTRSPRPSAGGWPLRRCAARPCSSVTVRQGRSTPADVRRHSGPRA